MRRRLSPAPRSDRSLPGSPHVRHDHPLGPGISRSMAARSPQLPLASRLSLGLRAWSGRCKSGLKRLFPGWPAAEEGLRAPSNAPSPTPLTPSRRSRASSRSPRASPPGPWINAACVCAADVSLGHQHDFRVKHLSEALNDKHGPLAGEYAAQPSPARGQPPLPSQQPPEGPEDGPGLSLSPSISLSFGHEVSLPPSSWECVPGSQGPGPRGEAAAPWTAGREGRWLPGGQGARHRLHQQLRLPGARPWAHSTRSPVPASSSGIQSPPGAADSQGALPLWGSRCLLNFNPGPAGLIGRRPRPSYRFRKPGWAGHRPRRPSVF